MKSIITLASSLILNGILLFAMGGIVSLSFTSPSVSLALVAVFTVILFQLSWLATVFSTVSWWNENRYGPIFDRWKWRQIRRYERWMRRN